MNYDDPKLLDRLAAEYVFGSLSARARRRFERLRQQLPAAEKAARDWETRLMPLSGSVPSERPPARVWNAIDERTGGGERRPSTRPWRWLRPVWGFAFGALAALGVVRLFPEVMPIEAIVQERGTLPQSYVGLLTDAQNNAVLLASSTRYGRVLSVKRLRPVEVPSGRVPVLWALPRDGAPFVVASCL
jgi:anti-sigma-K factor RskA